MKSKREILLETVEYYSQNPRSLNLYMERSVCRYNGLGGTHCAFARVVEPLARPLLREGKCASAEILRLGDGILLPEYQEHEPEFWDHVQRIHDGDGFWEGNTFTDHGKEYLADLLQRIT